MSKYIGEKVPLFKVQMAINASNKIGEVLDSGMIGEGPTVKRFAELLAERFNNKNLVLTNSCTSALIMALRLAGVGPGDYVISTPYTMIATNMAILEVGAKIIWADIDEDTSLISSKSLLMLSQNAEARKAKAIVATAIGGLCPIGTDWFFDIPVILDAAHAIGTTVYGNHISHLYDYTCLSFQSIKQLTTGDGGALLMKKPDQLEEAEQMKWFGISRKVPEGMSRLEHQMTSDITTLGGKFHMNDIAAAMGIANLSELDNKLLAARKQAAWYNSELSSIPGVKIPRNYPFIMPSWWLYWIRVNDRDDLMNHLESHRIDSSPMWRPNYEYSIFGNTNGYTHKSVEKVAKESLFIPIGHWIKDNIIRDIIEVIKKFYSTRSATNG